jgi:DNA-binding response OmpR family regulator
VLDCESKGKSHGKRCRFSAVFEMDLASEELRKNGLKIKLRGQPFQILAMLLEPPG